MLGMSVGKIRTARQESDPEGPGRSWDHARFLGRMIALFCFFVSCTPTCVHMGKDCRIATVEMETQC